ncbi:DUF2358 domain containing protein [Nitzschia inconspicua]|uniref:DUF2358 domain containing protein n=1 Tax=Nitzschia inconspicua TaxID=303405 RepID=A0A9K3PU96_9STRA|nr:DUF2358 domain containing protein [Nitzschia inconspicua]
MESCSRKRGRTLALLATTLALFSSCNLETHIAEAFSRNSLVNVNNHLDRGNTRILRSNMILCMADEKVNEVSMSTTSSSSGSLLSSALNPMEAWCITHMDVLYSKSLSIKCPFIRRRTADFLDGMDMVMRFLIIRHKSLPLIGPPPGCRSLSDSTGRHKRTHLPLADLVETIRQDWKTHNHKGYYITGRLNTTIYRDDCFFDGPDPDMPVRGLRKYLNAASQLFDTATSTAELISLELGQVRSETGETKTLLPKDTHATIVARWQLQGVLHLPWHPALPKWRGTTVYHLDETHLVYRHEEFWDISVLQAFTQTLWPQVGNRIWNKPAEESAS